MSIETEVAALTAQTTALLAAVTAAKSSDANKRIIQRTVFFGDSITANGFLQNGTFAEDANDSFYTGATLARTEDYGYSAWADFIAFGGFGVVDNAGVGGNTTTQMQARVQADVISKTPTIIVDNGGTNDVIAGNASESIIARKSALFDLYEGIGAAIVAVQIIPRSLFTAAMVLEAVRVNRWLRQQARTRKRFVLVEAAAVMADAASLTGGVSAARTMDDTHPNNLGAFLMGREVAAACRNLIGPQLGSMGWAGDAFGANSPNAIVRNSNPMMVLGVGGSANTGVSGSIAEGYTCSRLAGTPTAVGSIVERADGKGFAQRLVITFAAASDAIEFGIPVASSRYLADRIMDVQADISFLASSDNVINRAVLYSICVVGGVTHTATAFNQQDSTRRGNLPLSSGMVVGRAKSPRIKPATGAASGYNAQLRLYASAAGTVTVDISLFQMRLWPLV